MQTAAPPPPAVIAASAACSLLQNGITKEDCVKVLRAACESQPEWVLAVLAHFAPEDAVAV